MRQSSNGRGSVAGRRSTVLVESVGILATRHTPRRARQRQRWRIPRTGVHVPWAFPSCSEFRSTGLLWRAGGPIRIQDFESFRLIQPQPQLVVPSLFQPPLEHKIEALEISIMRFGALEGGDRQVERSCTGDVFNI